MALPTSAVQDLGARIQSGVIIGFKPTTGTRYRIELQRATANSTASSKWTSIFLDPTSQQFAYRDVLPLSTRTYYYRARQLGIGTTASSFSLTVSAKSQRFPEVLKPLVVSHNNLGNVEVLGGDLWLSSSKTTKVGQQQAAGTITKTIRITHPEFVPDTEGGKWEYRDGYLKPHTIAGTQFYHAPLHIPPGVTLTQLAARFYRNAVGDFAFVQILSTGDVGTGSSLGSVTHNTTGWQTKTVALSELVTATTNYALSASLGATVTDTDARLAWVEITYTMPDYAKEY
jgi:hypothetical protein